MNNLIAPFLFFALTLVSDAFEVHKSAWTAEQMSEARARAVEKGKGIMFIMANPDTAIS